MKITLVHLDLGIGGAEKLVINIAICLKRMGHDVRILTSHHDLNHCFEETKKGGILHENIHVIGGWIPHHFFQGKFVALLAIIRMCYIVLNLLMHPQHYPECVFIDGVSAPIPLLYYTNIPILFYCHFPDLLLCVERQGILKRIYRLFVDTIEEYTLGCADILFVNSEFTNTVVQETFPRICRFNRPIVLYPTLDYADNNKTTDGGDKTSDALINTECKQNCFINNNRDPTISLTSISPVLENSVIAPSPRQILPASVSSQIIDTRVMQTKQLHVGNINYGLQLDDDNDADDQSSPIPYTKNYDFVFLSLNRYERKKELGIALEAIAMLNARLKALRKLQKTREHENKMHINNVAEPTPHQLLETGDESGDEFDSDDDDENENDDDGNIVEVLLESALDDDAAGGGTVPMLGEATAFSGSTHSRHTMHSLKVLDQGYTSTAMDGRPVRNKVTTREIYHSFLRVIVPELSEDVALDELEVALLKDPTSPLNRELLARYRNPEHEMSEEKDIIGSNGNPAYCHDMKKDSKLSDVLLQKGESFYSISKHGSSNDSSKNTSTANMTSLFDSETNLNSSLCSHSRSLLYPGTTEDVCSGGPNSPTKGAGLIKTSSMRKASSASLSSSSSRLLRELTRRISSARVLLVVAGGYDSRVEENVQYLEELKQCAEKLNLNYSCSLTDSQSASISAPDSIQQSENITDAVTVPHGALAAEEDDVTSHDDLDGCASSVGSYGSRHGASNTSNIDVVFRTSISNEERKALLQTSIALLYTPDREHFGIVPIEAMFEGTPVIAVNSGGPKETVVHGKTGFLCSQTAKSFSEAMLVTMLPVFVRDPHNDLTLNSGDEDVFLQPSSDAISSSPLSQTPQDSPLRTGRSNSSMAPTRVTGIPMQLNLPNASSTTISPSTTIHNDLTASLSTAISSSAIAAPESIDNVMVDTGIIMPLGALLGAAGHDHVMEKFTPSRMEQTLSEALRMSMYRVLPEASRNLQHAGGGRGRTMKDSVDNEQNYIMGNLKRTKYYSSFVKYSIIGIFIASLFGFIIALLLAYLLYKNFTRKTFIYGTVVYCFLLYRAIFSRKGGVKSKKGNANAATRSDQSPVVGSKETISDVNIKPGN